MTELLPCPFCGEHAYVRVISDGFEYEADKDKITSVGYKYRVRCECSVCHSKGKHIRTKAIKKQPLKASGFLYEGKEYDYEINAAVLEAVKAWNTRAGRTCRNISGKNWWAFECSECGEMIEQGVPEYCPSCGAKVVGE